MHLSTLNVRPELRGGGLNGEKLPPPLSLHQQWLALCVCVCVCVGQIRASVPSVAFVCRFVLRRSQIDRRAPVLVPRSNERLTLLGDKTAR